MKGRRFETADEAARFEELSRFLDPQHFPSSLGRHGRGMLVEWRDGVNSDEVRSPNGFHERCGEILGALHATSVPDPVRVSHGFPFSAWGRRLENNVDKLVGSGVLSQGEAELTVGLAKRQAPGRADTGLIHGDFCAENIVVGVDGRPWIVDNERLTVDAFSYDLARTWYRWPMSGIQWDAFLSGYRRNREAETFEGTLGFWALAVLSEAAAFRVVFATPGAHVPVDRLKQLVRVGSQVTPRASIGHS
ncbi:MAG: aminoglycoside phosphotransferase family protein [Gemmatimonadota bacterium]|nr:MAG: aminoglycoside phosphotransferase family protein [Gemmatimonadota bacterium]